METMTDTTPPTREEFDAARDKAHRVVWELCKGKREWVMRIPADRDRDPDLLISDALLKARAYADHLERKLLEMELELRELEVECWEARLEWASKGEATMLSFYTYEACLDAVESTKAHITEIRKQLKEKE